MIINEQTIEQRLLDIDPSIVFGSFADTIFGTATAKTILTMMDKFSITPLDLVGISASYTVYHGTGQLPSFSRYRWSDAYDTAVPTRVVFQLDTVKRVE
jgi:hypothetical protein